MHVESTKRTMQPIRECHRNTHTAPALPPGLKGFVATHPSRLSSTGPTTCSLAHLWRHSLSMDWVIYAIAHPALTQPPFGRGNLVSTDTIIANVVLALRVGEFTYSTAFRELS